MRIAVSLPGRRAEMIPQTASTWIARNEPDLVLREDVDSYTVSDGNGLKYKFTQDPLLFGTGLWLLESISGPGGASVVLTYSLAAVALANAPAGALPGVAIDLSRVSYNPHPTAGCFKHEIGLDYAIPFTPKPESLSVVGTRVLVREHRLIAVNVRSRAKCGDAPQRIRRYRLDYQHDPDTQQERLVSVSVFGRAGTPEENASIPIAAYTYGTATSSTVSTRVLRYETTPQETIPIPAGPRRIARTDDVPAADFQPPVSDSSTEATRSYALTQTLLDMTGDGRPDLVYRDDNKLWLKRNQSTRDFTGVATTSFGPASESPALLNDGTFTRSLLDIRASRYGRHDRDPTTALNFENVWTQMIDVNGDGRVDVIDATEKAYQWVVYLNTPDPGASGVKWVRRAYDVRDLYEIFVQRGLITRTANQGFLPVSFRYTGRDWSRWMCWKWNTSTQQYEQSENDLDDPERCPANELVLTATGEEQTFIDWEVKDVNGDGYPDVLFNSAPVRYVASGRPTCSQPLCAPFVRNEERFSLQPISLPNRIEAVFNVGGVFISADDSNSTPTNPFSAPVVLISNSECGVGKWFTESARSRTQARCGFADVNGDGLLDRVDHQKAFLGTGSGFFTVAISLPGQNTLSEKTWLTVQDSDYEIECNKPDTEFYKSHLVQALRDLTGDGIPDFVEQKSSGGYQVYIGTGAGFADPVAIEGSFELSHSEERCRASARELIASDTVAGLFDIDGDGRPERVDLVTPSSGGYAFATYHLVGGTTRGNLEAGRLVRIDNGYGASTSISYESAKDDPYTRHQVPFPEIVVSSIATTSLAPTRYAYGNIELFYDSMADAFRPIGYLRRVELTRSLSNDPRRSPLLATAKITDRYPLQPVNPLTLRYMTAEQRFGRYLLPGRVRDTTVLAGALPQDPWALLTIDTETDAMRNAGVHHQVATSDTRLFNDTVSPTDDLCEDIAFPYDFELSEENNDPNYNPCSARGFVFTALTSSWQGSSAPPASDNVQTQTSVRTVDDLGRPTSVFFENDAYRVDDDYCVDTRYAIPVDPVKRVTNAVASRKVWNCPRNGESSVVYAEEAWEYDKLFPGLVGQGLVTAHTIFRHTTDTGASLSVIREYDVDYDGSANPIRIVRTREDGTTHTTLTDYDEFGLISSHTSVSGSDVPTLHTFQTFDPISNDLLSSTDENGTIRGMTFDGFGRQRLNTIETPQGRPGGVLVARTYLGFEEGAAGTNGRRVSVTEFKNPVDVTLVGKHPGSTVTTFVDELGRTRFSEVELGEDYGNERLIVGARTYDSLGRVDFEADPYPASQDAASAYGTTRYFDTDGTVTHAIRGRGQQPFTTTPDSAVERFPTLFGHTFANHRESRTSQGPDALSPDSPQFGVVREEVSTAVGRVLSRSTWQSGVRLEHAELGYDPTGAQTRMTRYRDASAAAGPVEWSWQFDSLGQVLRLTEPSAAPQDRIYSNWGELKAITWKAGPMAPTHNAVSTYDAFGRPTHTEEQNGGVTDAATINNYRYDVAGSSSIVKPTYMLGRLASASAPTGQTVLSYDDYGRVNARSFRDPTGTEYVEKHGFHGDGSQAWIELALPDNKYLPERMDYEYDTAGHLRWMWYLDGSNTQELYNASQIDAWGRLRSAVFGKVTAYTASFDDSGRRLPKEVNVSASKETRHLSFTRFDAADRELSREERLPNFSGNQTVSYDAIGRLQASTKTQINGQPAALWTFDYDALGNTLALNDRLGAAGAAMSFQTEDRDRICQIGYGAGGLSGSACNVDYDSLGNMVVQPTRTGSRRLAYFNSGRARSLENTSGLDVTNTTFRYDAFGALQELDLTRNGVVLQSDRHYGTLISTHYQRTPGSKGRKNDLEYVERRFPGPGLVISRHGKRGPWIFAFSESRGTRFTVDEDGHFVQDLDFSPYGETSSSGATSADISYTTQQWNGGDTAGTFGLVRLGARFYDPVIGRFLSRDPLLTPRTAASSNPYSFAFNDPANFTDPAGLDPCAGNPYGLCISTSVPGGDSGSLGWSAASAAFSLGLSWFGSDHDTSASSSTAQLTSTYQPAGSSLITMWDTAQRGQYMKSVAQNSEAGLVALDAAKSLEEAEWIARQVSAERNAIRLATQSSLSPAGRALSEVLDRGHTWESIFENYSKNSPSALDTFRRIVVSAGRSRGAVKLLYRIGKVAGPVGLAVGAVSAIRNVWNAPKGLGATVALREAGAFADSAAGATIGGYAGARVAGVLGMRGLGAMALGMGSGFTFGYLGVSFLTKSYAESEFTPNAYNYNASWGIGF
jgi:RHS repeat-associated protein